MSSYHNCRTVQFIRTSEPWLSTQRTTFELKYLLNQRSSLSSQQPSVDYPRLSRCNFVRLTVRLTKIIPDIPRANMHFGFEAQPPLKHLITGMEAAQGVSCGAKAKGQMKLGYGGASKMNVPSSGTESLHISQYIHPIC